MNVSYLNIGSSVVTAKGVGAGEIVGCGVDGEASRNRRPGAEGSIQGFVPEQQGEVWLVRHQDGKVGAYHHDELNFPKALSMPSGFRS